MKVATPTIACVVLLAGVAQADSKGEQIAHKYFDRKQPTDTRALGSTMTLIDSSGGRKTRKLDLYYQEKSTGQNAFTAFSEPADVSGTKFLTIGHRGGDSDQRLYLPALKKVRKIAASAKDGEFVNSDFWFYDLEERYFEDNTYTFLSENETIPDKAFAGMKFYKIEMAPTRGTSPYAKAVAYVNMDNSYIYKMECFDKKDGSLLKTMLVVKLGELKGFLVPEQLMMINHKKGTKTLLQFNDLAVNVGLADDVFSVQNLEK